MEYSIALLYIELANIESFKSDNMSGDEKLWDLEIILRCDKIISDLNKSICLLEKNK